MSTDVLYYDVIESHLDNNHQNYRGIIEHSESLNNEDLIDEIVKSNTTITRQDALGVIDLYEQLIKMNLRKGYTITTGLFRADLSMTGSFSHAGEKIDYKKHKAKVVIRPAKKLSQQVSQGLRFHRQRNPRDNHYLGYVIDMIHRLSPGQLRAGSSLKLTGKGLKSYNHENHYDLSLINLDKEVYALTLMTASYQRITAMMPKEIAPGKYQLQLKHHYGERIKRTFHLPVEVVE